MESSTGSVRLTGWATFAGIVLVIVGSVNLIYGLAAIFRDEVITTTGAGGPIVWDVTAWGWVLLLFGILQILAGLGLFAGVGWARWTAVVLASLNAIANVGFITVFPLWTLLIVGLDLVVIYQLSARWMVADPDLTGTYRGAEGGVGSSAARDQATRIQREPR
jgi:hypothetical protein